MPPELLAEEMTAAPVEATADVLVLFTVMLSRDWMLETMLASAADRDEMRLAKLVAALPLAVAATDSKLERTELAEAEAAEMMLDRAVPVGGPAGSATGSGTARGSAMARAARPKKTAAVRMLIMVIIEYGIEITGMSGVERDVTEQKERENQPF